MSTSEERALVTEIEDRLIELYVQQDEARRQKIGTERVSCKSRSMRRQRSGRGFAAEALRIAVSNGSGGSEMAKARGRTQRRHVREKATIDHLVQNVYEPKAPDEEHTDRSPTTSSGLPVEDQVRKEWDSSKGGLPTFFDKP
jgi:hypothetical protein